MKIGSIVFAILVTASAAANNSNQVRVDNSFLGQYKLITTERGECAESVQLTVKETSKYSLWITYRNEANEFVGNEKFDDLNAPLQSSTNLCMTAGPVNPFCYESRKEVTKYDEKTKVLETFSGQKTTFTKAKYSYTKVELMENGIKVTQLKMEKPMVYGVFPFITVEDGATNTAYYTFPDIKKDSVCVYDSQNR